jgi:hypothetical protein
MSALLVTALAFIPVAFFALAFLRSTILSKYLDDPHTKRRN